MFERNSTTNDFDWCETDEPHKSRRMEILKKYPEIKRLMLSNGDRHLVVQGLLLLVLQFYLAAIVDVQNDMLSRFFINAFLGNWVASLLLFHMHEAAHGLVFGPNAVWKNRLYGLLINFGLGVPFFSFFKKHHKNHHKYLGDEFLDAEYPSPVELRFFPNTFLGKYFWLVAQPLLFTWRMPLLVLSKPKWWIDTEEILNIVSMAIFAFFCFYWSRNPFFYLHFTISLLSATSSNIFGYWGVMSHTEFFKMKETNSYYGWMNDIFLNFGYHVEHHDFPNVPSRFLPQIRKIAPEYYEEYFQLDSFHTATLKYLFDPKIGIFSRLKRPHDENKLSYCMRKK